MARPTAPIIGIERHREEHRGNAAPVAQDRAEERSEGLDAPECEHARAPRWRGRRASLRRRWSIHSVNGAAADVGNAVRFCRNCKGLPLTGFQSRKLVSEALPWPSGRLGRKGERHGPNSGNIRGRTCCAGRGSFSAAATARSTAWCSTSRRPARGSRSTSGWRCRTASSSGSRTGRAARPRCASAHMEITGVRFVDERAA